MHRRPLSDVLLQQTSNSFTTLLAFVIGAVTILYVYKKKIGKQRPPHPIRGLDTGSSQQQPSMKDVDVDVLTKLRKKQFKGSKMCCAWDVFFSNGEWLCDGKAKDILSWYASTLDVYLMCRISSQNDKIQILKELKGIDGLQRHKILFCTTPKGYEAFTRQISPTILVTHDSSQAMFLSGILPYIILVGEGKTSKSNVSFISSISQIECDKED
ncbi:unnamed protein product [Phytomonas sp. EM1]|nr:unnamed protein product [Phytomonas sp. EM1]|eukprot:CCW60160.1 unnamed protein product [Phytomonas sp. isolate EM1]